MRKQKELLKQIINLFYMQGCCMNGKQKALYCIKIHELYKLSLNKSDLVRRVLNGCVLSNDDIIELLRLFFFKQ